MFCITIINIIYNSLGDTNPDANAEQDAAAAKIQAGFRGNKARKEVKEVKQRRESESAAATKIQAGFRGNKARNEVKQRRASESEAATKIQAGFRGSKARRDVKQLKESKTEVEKVDEEENEDQEVEEAATKIQAGFRGHKAREQVKSMKESLVSGNYSVPEGLDLAAEGDDDVFSKEKEVAATKIQAGFRGQKARKEVESIRQEKIQTTQDSSCTETSEYSPGYFELHGIETDTEKTDQTMSSLRTSKDPVQAQKESMESQVSHEENTIKEKLEDEEDDDIETEFLEDDLDDYTESSASVSEKSANAPIRNKKMPFTLVRKILTMIVKPKNKVGASASPVSNETSVFASRNSIDEDNSRGSSASAKSKSKFKSTKVEPFDANK